MLKELEPIAGKLRETRGVLNGTLDKLTDEQATRVMVTPEWSIKDAVAHLAGAERGMLRIAQRMARGEDPQLSPNYDNDEANARMVAKRKGQPLAEIRKELDASRAELMAFLEGLTADKLALMGQHPLEGETTLKDLLVIVYSHETTHCKEIIQKCGELKK